MKSCEISEGVKKNPTSWGVARRKERGNIIKPKQGELKAEKRERE